MSDWRPIGSAPEMRAILVHHEYYSHGQIRHAFMDQGGVWFGVNANGTQNELLFEPTAWMPLPTLSSEDK